MHTASVSHAHMEECRVCTGLVQQATLTAPPLPSYLVQEVAHMWVTIGIRRAIMQHKVPIGRSIPLPSIVLVERSSLIICTREQTCWEEEHSAIVPTSYIIFHLPTHHTFCMRCSTTVHLVLSACTDARVKGSRSDLGLLQFTPVAFICHQLVQTLHLHRLLL